MEKLYCKIWAVIGGRPWTYIIRDCWHKYEFFWIVGLVSLGIWLGQHLSWKPVLAGWLIFGLGYLAGHLFWGTPYQENQQG